MEYPKFSVLMPLYIKEKAEYFDGCIDERELFLTYGNNGQKYLKENYA